MTKIRRYTIPSAAALVVAAGLGLATAPAQAALVTYTGCASGSFCTMTELLAGGSISVDEDGNGTIEKVFKTWTDYVFSASGPNNLLPDPKNNIRVSATGTYIPGVSGSATLNYTVVNNALNVAPTSANTTWFANLNFKFTVTSAGYVPIMEQTDNLTGASVVGPSSGTVSSVSFNNTTKTSGTGSMMTDTTLFNPPLNTLEVGNTLALQARRTNTIIGTANLTSFSQTFNQVVIPEPGTVVGVLAVGGLGLAMKRRQKDN